MSASQQGLTKPVTLTVLAVEESLTRRCAKCGAVVEQISGVVVELRTHFRSPSVRDHTSLLVDTTAKSCTEEHEGTPCTYPYHPVVVYARDVELAPMVHAYQQAIDRGVRIENVMFQ